MNGPIPMVCIVKVIVRLHPEVHSVVFDLIDEICEVFETDAFHAGLNEVFYIAHEDCPRCRGHDPAVFVCRRGHKNQQPSEEKNRELWMWGDRLIDGKTTGIDFGKAVTTTPTAPLI